TTGTGNAIKASGNSAIVGVGFDKSDAIQNLIQDGHLLCTMAQNPDVMGYEGVKAAVAAIGGESLGGAVTDTGVSVINAAALGGAAASAAGSGVTASKAWKIALITMDSIDQHWVTLNEGAQEKAKELGVEVTFMSPNTKDDAQQIECVNNAVAGKYD
ncbi:sugar ABC transporter, partial [Lachnospiraceae bacterium]|nr:sugar ABC transporter [Lachnospiraceae bacterium]